MRGRSSHPPAGGRGDLFAAAACQDPFSRRRSSRPGRAWMTLQALREKIGDFAFFSLLRAWAISGQDRTQFFKVWIYEAENPAPGSR